MVGSPLAISGLASGFDTQALIEALTIGDKFKIQRVQQQVAKQTDIKTAYLDLSAKLLALKTSTGLLRQPVTFQSMQVQSSNPQQLLATAKSGFNLLGAFQFTVNRLATADQFVSKGFSATNAPLTAGTFMLEVGNGSLRRETDLNKLRGGLGVDSGQIKVTDKTGSTQVIDLRSALTVNDVIDKINQSNLQVTAALNASGDGIQVTDTSGGANNLKIENVGTDTAATDLGILGNTAGNTLGATSSLMALTGATQLTSLNDGRGVRMGGGIDMVMTLSDGATVVNVDLGAATTMQDVVTAINNSDPSVQAAISADGKRLEITDTLGGPNTISIANGGLSFAADDLGISDAAARSQAAGYTQGARIVSGVNTVLLSSLNGGAGVDRNSISVTDRLGNAAVIDLSGAETMHEAMEAINNNGVAQVRAEVNSGGSGLRIVDLTGSTVGNLIINEAGGSTAADLGIENGAGAAGAIEEGGNLQFQYINGNTQTSELNGGTGVFKGSIRITNKNGDSFTVSLAEPNNNNIQSILDDITFGTGSTVVATINATGDGILLTDTTGQTGTLKVEEVSGSTAKDLNILGSTTGDTIDGSYEYRVDIGAGETLEDLRQKINELGIGVSATILNDGSGATPFRLNLVNTKTGAAGRLTIHSADVGVEFNQTAKGRDAVVLFGESGGGVDPLLLRSSTNAIQNVVSGLDITLLGASANPVTVTSTRDTQGSVTQVQNLVGSLNQVLDTIKQLTIFIPDTNQKGLLFGDSMVRNIESQIHRFMTSQVTGLDGSITSMAELGVRATETGAYTFDSGKMQQALGANFDDVLEFFTKLTEIEDPEPDGPTFKHVGFGYLFDDYLDDVTNTFDGTIATKNQGIDQTIEQLNKTIEGLNERLESKEERLVLKFANLEILMGEAQNTLMRLQQFAPVQPVKKR